MQEKVLMKGNEAIAEAAIRGRLPSFLRLSHHSADGDRGLYGQAHAEDRRHLSAGGERNRGHQHGLWRGLRRQARAMTSSSSPGISAQERGHLLHGRLRPALRSSSTCSAAALVSAASSRRSRIIARRQGRRPRRFSRCSSWRPHHGAGDGWIWCSEAFDLADQYRMPAMILADGTLGQMMEPVVLPEEPA